MIFISLTFIQIISHAMTFTIHPKGIGRLSIVDAQTIEDQTWRQICDLQSDRKSLQTAAMYQTESCVGAMKAKVSYFSPFS